ncbi:hypothetical protein ABVK25_008296 [Lepraria finkii]|uniref:Uncharacterized protein n=1 Tax=Lepraria finkii TaxID=1340010 RepID=A0ABR4B0R2_9LECA
MTLLERQIKQTSLLNDLQHLAAMKGQIDDNADYLDKSIWVVPTGRNPSFFERNAVMSDLESKLLPMPDVVPTAVLCGFGVVG